MKKSDFKEPIFNQNREPIFEKGKLFFKFITHWEAFRKNIQFYFPSTKLFFTKLSFHLIFQSKFSKLKKRDSGEHF